MSLGEEGSEEKQGGPGRWPWGVVPGALPPPLQGELAGADPLLAVFPKILLIQRFPVGVWRGYPQEQTWLQVQLPHGPSPGSEDQQDPLELDWESG